MQRKFLSNLFITLGANLLVKPIWILGIDRSFQNKLGLQEYGQYASLFTFSLVLGLLLDFGINNYNSSSLARNPQVIHKQFAPLLFIKFGLGLVYILLTLLLGWLYGFNGHYLWLLGVLCLNQILAYISTFFRSTLSGLQLFKTDALISSVDRLTMVVVGGSVLLFSIFTLSIDTFIYIQTIGYAMAVIVSFIALLPQLSNLHFRVQFNEIKPALVKSLPFAVLALLMMLYTKLDVLLIKKMLPNGDVENGIYAQSTRLLEAVNMLAVMVSALLLPMFSSMLKQRESITPLVKLAMLILWIPAIMGVVFCYHYSADIMALLYYEYNPYHAAVFVWCISSVLPICVMYIFGTLLTARGKLFILINTAVVALLVNIVANYFLIPKMGAEGAAIVALVTQSLVAMVNTFFVLRQMPVRIGLLHLLKFPLLAFFCYVLLTILISAGVGFLSIIFIYVIVSAALVVVLQIIDVETLKRALKRFR